MRTSTLLIAGMLAMPFVGVPSLALAQQPDAAGNAVGTQTGEIDAALVERLAVIPDSAIVGTQFWPMLHSLQSGEKVTETLRMIVALDADVQALFWLRHLETEMQPHQLHSYFTREALVREEATSKRRDLKEKGITGAEADAYIAPILAGASYRPRHAGAVIGALWHAGLKRQHTAFMAAQALAARDRQADFSVLDADFGNRDDLRTATDDYAARSPAIAAWKAGLRAAMSEKDRLEHLRGNLEFLNEQQVRSLSKPLRIIHCVHVFHRLMFNRDLSEFFGHPAADHAPETVAAMRAMGLTGHADVMQRGIDTFGTPYPTDWQVRKERLKELGTANFDRDMDAMKPDVTYTEIDPALLSLAKRHGLLPR